MTPAFGRGQSFDFDGRRVVLQLVKNPAGFRQTLRTLDGAERASGIVIAINDDYADGRDVSWLWDVDFTALAGHDCRLITSGTRAADMAVRLRYDDVRRRRDRARPGEGGARGGGRRRASAQPGAVVVFSTYTAMWALHPIMLRIAEER